MRSGVESRCRVTGDNVHKTYFNIDITVPSKRQQTVSGRGGGGGAGDVDVFQLCTCTCTPLDHLKE